MINLFSKYKAVSIFIILFLSIWISTIILCFLFSKFEIHIFLNNYHTKFFDLTFYTLTYLGDGVFACAISLFFFLIKKKKEGVLLLSTFIFSALIAQFLKNYVFEDYMRPYYYIESGIIKAPIIEGVNMHKKNSFPSGHTTTIFAICSMICFFYQSRKLGVLLVLIAILIAYSRIYLSQHFLIDTIAGSFIGVCSSLVTYSILNKKLTRLINN